jgi:lipocalin-like protein
MLSPEEIAGVYRQVGADLVTADGTVTSTGDTRNSQLMYSADGYMAIVSTPPDRAKVSGSNPVDLGSVPIEELPGAVKDMVVYAGRFVLKDGNIEHLVDMALNPNLVGGAVIRRVTYDGTNLTLSSAPTADGSYRNIRWRRVAP